MEQTAKVSEDKIPFPQKFSTGAALSSTICWPIQSANAIVLNLGLGMNPALVGLLGALPRLTDAITDPLMGYISDNTRSRWGAGDPTFFAARFWWGSLRAALAAAG